MDGALLLTIGKGLLMAIGGLNAALSIKERINKYLNSPQMGRKRQLLLKKLYLQETVCYDPQFESRN
jgi:hypothetical protein